MTMNLFRPPGMTRYPLNNITPFTYRDGLTYLELLEELRRYITDMSEVFNLNMDLTTDGIAEFQTWTEEAVAGITAWAENAHTEHVDWTLEQITELTDTITEASDRLEALALQAQQDSAAVVATFADLQANGAVVSINGKHGVVDIAAVYADRDYASLQAALDAVPSGATLEVRQSHVLSATVTVTRPVTLAFRGGSITNTVPGGTTGTSPAMLITSSDVHVTNAKIIGVGGNLAMTVASGIVVMNSNNVTITNSIITGMPFHGIRFENCKRVAVTGTEVNSVGYAGIMVLSCDGVVIDKCSIKDVYQTGTWVNSYGIALTHDSAATTPVRTRNATVSNTRVENVSSWEGIDSHGGQHITVTGCTVINCRIGIAMVPGSVGASEIWGPLDLSILGNYVESRDVLTQNGIKIVGAGTSSPATIIEAATGIVAGNTVVGTGTATVYGGISAYSTRGLAILNNSIVEPVGVGIHLYHSNVDMIVSGNKIVDVWRVSGGLTFACAIYVRSDNNTFAMSNNTLRRASLVADIVNTYGVYVGSATVGVVISDIGGNNWSGATTGVANTATRMTQGFYGDVGQTKPAVTGNVMSPDTTKLLIEKLALLGLMTNTTTSTKAVVDGSRAGNAALTSLLTALSGFGFIINNTTT